MSSKLVLYSMSISPPCRFVLMTLKTLGLKADVVTVDLTKMEHKSMEFTKMNPIQKIPVLTDGSLTMRDSHSICTYLVNKYGNQNSLYPKEPEARARVDDLLCFHMTDFFPASSAALNTLFVDFKKVKPSDGQWNNVIRCYALLDSFLKDSSWLAGDSMTLADLCFLTSFTIDILIPLDEQKYPHIAKWLGRCKNIPEHLEVNQPGVEELKTFIEAYCASNGIK